MTATIRKQIQRSRLAHSGGKRLDLYLTKEEGETLEAFRVARGLPNATEAVKALIEPHIGRVGDARDGKRPSPCLKASMTLAPGHWR